MKFNVQFFAVVLGDVSGCNNSTKDNVANRIAVVIERPVTMKTTHTLYYKKCIIVGH